MKTCITFLLTIVSTVLFAQQFTPNYDESKIPEYELPAILTSKDGSTIAKEKQWNKSRRDEIQANHTPALSPHHPVVRKDLPLKLLLLSGVDRLPASRAPPAASQRSPRPCPSPVVRPGPDVTTPGYCNCYFSYGTGLRILYYSRDETKSSTR